MYYCEAHQIAYTGANQWVGHWLNAHKGEPRPKAEEANVEEVPEGTTIAPPPAPKRSSQRAPASAGRSADDTGAGLQEQFPMGDFTSPYEDPDEAHLDQALDSIGVPQLQRQTIVKGWRNFPALQQYPDNLETHILDIAGPKYRGRARLVSHAMFPGAEPEDVTPQYRYGRQPYGRPTPRFWQEQYEQPWEPEPPRYAYRYARPGSPGAGNAEANPQVVALQKQLDAIIQEQQADRAERAREKQEQQQKEHDAAWQAQLNAVVGKVDTTFKEMGDLVKGLSEQLQRGRGDVEASHSQQLAEKVDTLTQTIADQREVHLQGAVDALRGELGDVRQKLNVEPTGKTTADLISLGIPLVVDELRNMGTAVSGELKGIRQQAADGKLPSLTPPSPPNRGNPGDQDPVKTAQQIAGARALEDEILSAVAGQPRS